MSDTVQNIARRASALYKNLGVRREPIEFMLDLDHLKEPGDLEQLYILGDDDFLHDVGGIAKHLNHYTGGLDDCFLPRYLRQ